MKKIILFLCLAALAALSACAPKTPADPLTVRTEAGIVHGFMDEDIYAFAGIPYCQAGRFQPPQKPDAWDGVLECTKYPPRAMQSMRPIENDPLGLSEDGATRLNVWTSDVNGKMPVMVWLHGGGFSSGAGYNNPNDSGRGLARQGVVVVSVNHRLNILGFLDLSACGEEYKYSGNVGMMDIVTALEWVRDNIASFGGDPSNVTIFGESGGGGKVGTLMCMPSAKGLFHKAIIQSGTLLNGNKSEASRALGLKTLEKLGLTPDQTDRLKDIPYEQLVQAGNEATAEVMGGVRRPGSANFWGFGPTLDGEILVMQPFQPSFSDLSADVPLMIGSTFNELQKTYYIEQPSEKEARKILKESYGKQADAYVAAFKKAYPEFDTPADWLSVDQMFRPNTVRTADARADEDVAPVYMYLFAWKSPIEGGRLGAAHAYELPFCFHTTEVSQQYLGEETDEIRTLADKMSGAWVSFAKTGKPVVEGFDWKPYTSQDGDVMYFAGECSLRHNFDRELVTIMQNR